MAKQKENAVPSEEMPIDIQDDEYRGMGGSYIFDPVTGKRAPAGVISASPETGAETTKEEKDHEIQ